MDVHFLVTISENIEHLFGVRFLCSFFSKLSQHHAVTLLHISDGKKGDERLSLREVWFMQDNHTTTQRTVRAENAMITSRALLLAKHMPADSIITKTVIEHYGKSEDILKEALVGQYDAIILGRRAAFSLQWMFDNPDDTTAQTIIKRLCSVPIWICPAVDHGRKHVLLCLDGFDNAYRAAEHVGYILASEADQEITLFHVETSDQEKSSGIFKRAEAILRGQGIEGTRIHWKTGYGQNVTEAIYSEINQGNYAATALGLRGEKPSSVHTPISTGGTVAQIIRHVDGAAVWCCP